MARNIGIWIFGLLASAIVGGFAASLFDKDYADHSAFWGVLAGVFGFACLRLWLGGPKANEKERTLPRANKPVSFAHAPELWAALGQFYVVWTRTELTIDCAMWKLRGTDTTPENAHKDSARMKFGAKCAQLQTLLGNSKLPNGGKAKELLNRIQHESLRNVFAHSFLVSDEHSVTFIHRELETGEGTPHTLLRQEFFDHVQNFVDLSVDFQQALGLSNDQVAEFAAFALPLSTEST
jgi:hypothetical protein